MSPTKQSSPVKKRVKAAVPKKGTSVKKSASTRAKKTPAKKVAKKTALKTPGSKLLKPKKKDTITNEFKKGERKPFSFPQSFALSVITMPRLPVDMDTLAIGLARYAGMFFIVVGALFTLWHSQAVGVHIPLLATVIESTQSTTNTTLTNTTSLSEQQTKPPVSFDVRMDAPAPGGIESIISVRGARSVSVFAFHNESEEYFPLGNAKKIAPETWLLQWNSVQFPAGRYRLKAQIVNEFGSYDASSERYIEVAPRTTDTAPETVAEPDEPNDETTTEPNDTAAAAIDNTSADSVPTAESGVTKVGIAFETTNEATRILLRPDVQPDTLVVKLVERTTGKTKELGLAERTGVLRWQTTVRHSDHEPGAYAVYVVAKKGDSEFTSPTTSFTIPAAVTTVATSPTTTVQETEPALVADPVVESKPVEEAKNTVRPQITVGRTVQGIASVQVQATEASFVEIYAQPLRSTNSKFIGLAKKFTADVWRHEWVTTNVPNGDYVLIARARTSNGLETVRSATVNVNNPLLAGDTSLENSPKTPMDEQRQTVQTEVALLKKNLASSTDLAATSVPPREKNLQAEFIASGLTNSKVLTAADVPEELSVPEEFAPRVAESVDTLVRENQNNIDAALQALASALRAEDEFGITAARNRLAEIRKAAVAAEAADSDAGLAEFIDNRIARKLSERTLEVERSERIIKERVGASITKDTDGDGISDFDEINLYQTDPLSADTDQDGFDDRVEILGGYNPLDASPEAVVTFESPKDTGVLRPDILKVTAITPVTPDTDDTNRDGIEPAAVISGMALPNSFVTLYVFSNPVVVTVRTDSDGNWSYRFDKELPDGEHEVYVGVTDNAGRVVAKSEPVRFVKTAEAFSPVAASAGETLPVSEAEAPLFSTPVLLVAASVSIVSIGLILLLLGLHLQRRREETELYPQTDQPEPQLV